jgi:murein DD-endopeptidase MepM/ murein hydrolase activator NlpD
VEPLAWWNQTAERGLLFAQQHRRSVVATVVATLAGFGVAAVAVAPLVPGADELPRRIVAEAVAPLPLEPQLEALAAHAFELARSAITRPGESAATLLQRLGVDDAQAQSFLRRDPVARQLFAGRPGKMVDARVLDNGRLVELVARYPAEGELRQTHFTRLVLTRDADAGWRASVDLAALESRVLLGSGTLRSTLDAAGAAAGIPSPVTAQIAEIFAGEIEGPRALRRGDSFSVVYEVLTADDEPVVWNRGTGRVLAAELVAGGRTLQALWFAGRDGRGGYFGPDGQSLRRSFLASPVPAEFSRVTSGFGMRMHPILRRLRKHEGVDFSAPVGTPVSVVGDGVVDFAGVQSGFGKVVIVRHSRNRQTIYAHLSRIDVRRGQRVEQGQLVGAVGSTGWSTGSHLHFEFHVNGTPKDPEVVARDADAVKVPVAERRSFELHAQRLGHKLDTARSTSTAALMQPRE